MSITKIINYDNPTNFTFDTDLMEVTTGAKLKNVIDTDELFFGDFAIKDLLRVTGGGSATGTLTGGASIITGKLDIPAPVGAFWEMDPTSMIGTDPNIVTHRFKVTPGFTTSPPATVQLFIEEDGASKNQIRMQVVVSGNINILFRDNAGGGQGTLVIPGWNPTAGTEYEFELDVNSTTGTQILYIDGLQLGPDHAATFTRDTNIDSIKFGAAGIAGDFKIDDYQRFSTLKHAANFASEIPRTIPLTTFITTAPTIIEVGFVILEALETFSSVETLPGTDEIKFILQVDLTDFYHDGGSWVPSNGTFAQSNTAVEINTNAAALGTNKPLRVKALLKSADGTTTPTLTSVTFSFDFFSLASDIKKCVVFGFVFDGCNPVGGADITFKADPYFDTQNNLVNINEEVSTASTGFFEITLPISDFAGTDKDTPVDVKISFIDSKNKRRVSEFQILIEDDTTCPIEDIII